MGVLHMSRTYKHIKKQKVKKNISFFSKFWDFIYPPSKSFKKSLNRGIKAKAKQQIKNGDYEVTPNKKSHKHKWKMEW